jgi:hypothetical protein
MVQFKGGSNNQRMIYRPIVLDTKEGKDNVKNLLSNPALLMRKNDRNALRSVVTGPKSPNSPKA